MSFTVTKIADTLEGNLRVSYFSLANDGSSTGNKVSKNDTGFNNIIDAQYTPHTSDDHGIIYKNYEDAGSTTSFGDIYIDSITASDEGTLRVVGT